MRSAIWKLSALATVVGVSLVTVVFLQGGLAKFPGLKMPGATAQTPASKPAPGKSSASGTSDPFAVADAADFDTKGPETTRSQSPPEQVPEPDSPELGAAGSAITGADADNFAVPATKSRTKARGLNFKSDSAGAEAVPSTLTDGEDAFPPGGRNRAAASTTPVEPDTDPVTDPAALEGSPPGDHATANLTSEEDPFAKHKQKATAGATAPRGTARRATASRSRPSIAEPDENPARAAGPGQNANPFDQPRDPNAEPVSATPVVSTPAGKSRSGSRARLIDEGGPIQEAPVAAPAAAVESRLPDDVVDDVPPPTGLQNPAAPRGNRPSIGEDGGFAERQPESTATISESVPPSRSSAKGTPRPQIVDDEEMRSAEPAAITSDGIQPIPKLQRSTDADEGDSDRLTPPIAKASGQRPNHLVDEDDIPAASRKPSAAAGGNPTSNPQPAITESESNASDPNLIDSAIPVPNSRRPSRHVLEIAPDDLSNPTSQPTAAASRSTATDVIAAPRMAATSGVPGIVATNPGRGRVTIEKVAPPTAYIGQPLIYQIRIRNVGNGSAQQVVVEDIVPEGVTMQGSIPQAELVGRKLSWRMGVLAAGEERQISVKIIPNTEGAVGSAATVNFVADPTFASTAEPDPVVPVSQSAPLPPANNSRMANVGNNGVTLELQGPRQVGLGQPFDVRFRLTNRTTLPINDLIIRKMLPEGLLHQSRIQDLEYRVGTLAAGEIRDVTMTLTATQPGRAASRAIVMTSDARVLQSTEFLTEVTAVGAVGARGASGANPAAGSQFSVTIERLGTARPALNQPVTYANRVTNRGARPTGGLRVMETLPPGMEFISAGDGGQYDPNTRRVYWELMRLEPNAAQELRISVVVRDKNPQTSTIVVADNAGNQSDTSAQIVASNTP